MRGRTLYHKAGRLGRATALANLVLLVILPVTWTLPLVRNSAFLVLSSEVTIFWGAVELARSDLFLALVVAVFAMVLPFLKCLLYSWLWFVATAPRPWHFKLGSVLAKLSMTDVFLIAVIILAVKGLRIGTVEPLYGLYLFSGVVLASVAVSILTDLTARRPV
ncbi:paraquat-inducible protein A [Thalassococcus sp. CAU 1522]|uniref:Paraquat-inducible protein A n=1 Tax=Thalassococcus arenae TaxID=2851652 RepID=A0ABS6N7K3_9RHOB|nr:paraquat-inducible protein A [Thalassococcus arenae]MBV2360005.1 paraquat-inducible protein A [Thalassococcus arenae]